MKLGKYDRKHPFLIAGAELSELKRHTEDLPQSFGLDPRRQRYQGTRPIALYRWDLEYLLDVFVDGVGRQKPVPFSRASHTRR